MRDYEKRRKPSNNRWIYNVLTYLFCAIIFLFSIVSIILPDKKYSEEENRVLAEFPNISWESIMDVSFMEGLESYVSDHFLGRDFWISMKVKCDQLIGKTEFNGVYLCDDRYLIQIPTEPDEKSLDRNLKAINKFAEEHSNLDINMMIVPNAISTMEDYLPIGAPARDQQKDAKKIQKALDQEIKYLDVSKVLKKHVDEGMYYKTDHHWTSKAAYYTFLDTAEELGISDPVTKYNVYKVTSDFSGTLASKSGYHKAKDSIEVYEPLGVDNDYIVTDSNGGEPRTTVYDRASLKEKDKYQVFFKGNQSRVTINTLNKTKKRLLVFKDSYANCFVPFLTPYYNEIIMVDPRYYYDDVHTLIERERITDVLFLYNMDTFMTDRSLADTLAFE